MKRAENNPKKVNINKNRHTVDIKNISKARREVANSLVV